METNNQEQQQPQGFMHSTTARVIAVGLLSLVLLLPLQFVKSLIWERQELQQNVTSEFSEQWGSVYFYGPVLKVPYKVTTDTEIIDKVTKKTTISRSTATEFAYFFPEKLSAKANVTTEKKNRGNYESTVFNSTMYFNGYYTSPDFAKKQISPQNVLWDKATVVINTNNLKAIKGALTVKLNGQQHNFEPVAPENGNDRQAYLETPAFSLDPATGKLPFDLDVNYDGSDSICIVPIGRLTEMDMASNWADPKFTGNFFPTSKSITETGFTANWKISHLNRPFVQQYFGSLPDLSKYSFDTEFIIKNNEYQQNERAAKYGFLVIGLTFLIFFLIQTISKIYIHIFQYSMIGLALIMFYTLLISITEHSSFSFAYIIAGAAVVVMITLYSVSILKNKKFPLLTGTSLAALYTFIYVIIQLEDYALLAGSIGLFAILGTVMYFSRKIEWNPTHQL